MQKLPCVICRRGRLYTQLLRGAVQVWFSSVAVPTGETGSISSVVQAARGQAAATLYVESIKVIGMPKQTAGQTVSASVAGLALPASAVQLSGEVMTISGLQLVVGHPMEVTWKFTAAQHAAHAGEL